MPQELLRFAKNVGWLLVPVFLWNAFLTARLPHSYLPDVFNSNIPAALSTTESALRFLVCSLPFFAPFELAAKMQKRGIVIYGVGLALYFISWLALIAAPNSAWSQSAIGFLAPAYTPIVWLLGLALMMQRLHWQSPYRWWLYLILSMAFLSAHISHASLVFTR
jgi:hypothetical protein